MKTLISDKQHFLNTLFISGMIVFAPVLVFLMQQIFDWNLDFLGVAPRQVKSLYGILTHVLVHGDWSHLWNNTVSFFILTFSLFYFYGKIADRVFILSWVMMGTLLWMIGRDSIHIGASGLIFAEAFFLFWSGIIRKHIPLIAIALVVVFLYGNMVWHIFPWQPFVQESWEGHLSGAIAGTFLAYLYRKEGPQRPVKNWDEQLETEDDKELAEYAESFELEGDEKSLNETIN
jgi:membrane associated rhomboid family serine protease